MRMAFGKLARVKGQNLVEMMFTLPFIVLTLFFLIELGRIWFTYEGAKMAAMEGAHTAAIYHNSQAGRDAMNARLSAAGMNILQSNINQNQHNYQATVQVQYTPFFLNLVIPTLSGGARVIDGPSAVGWPVTYTAVEDVSVY